MNREKGRFEESWFMRMYLYGEGHIVVGLHV